LSRSDMLGLKAPALVAHGKSSQPWVSVPVRIGSPEGARLGSITSPEYANYETNVVDRFLGAPLQGFAILILIPTHGCEDLPWATMVAGLQP